MFNKEEDTINFFSWSTTFDATVVVDDVIYPNRYNVSLSFIPKTKEISYIGETATLHFKPSKSLIQK